MTTPINLGTLTRWAGIVKPHGPTDQVEIDVLLDCYAALPTLLAIARAAQAWLDAVDEYGNRSPDSLRARGDMRHALDAVAS